MDPYAGFLPNVLKTGKQLVQSQLGTRLALKTQPRYEAPDDRWFQSAVMDSEERDECMLLRLRTLWVEHKYQTNI